MKLTGTITVFALTLTFALPGQAARGDMIEGSIVISALWADMDEPDISDAAVFTPTIFTSGTMTLAGGDGDFAGLDVVPAITDPLDITDPTAWTFTSDLGSWTTTSFLNTDPSAANGFLAFQLTGVFAPNPNGLLAAFEPSPANMRISLTQSGSTPRASWGGSMSMIPEPMTATILGVGCLAILRRRRGA